MAFHIDNTNGDIVIDSFDKGVGDSPYGGITDLKSVNPSSIPNEVSVAFSTVSEMKAPIVVSGAGTLASGTPGTFLAAESLLLEERQWITFSALPAGSGLSTATPYYLFHNSTSGPNEVYQLFAQTAGFPPTGSALNFTNNGAATFSTVSPGIPKYFDKGSSYNYMLDSNGRVWSDAFTTQGGGGVTATHSWTWLGNGTDSTSNGNGLLLYKTVHNGTGGISGGIATPSTFDEFLFVWRNDTIDYTNVSTPGTGTNPTWVTGWNYGLTGGTTTGNSGYLNTSSTVNNPHQAVITPDGRVNFVDGNFLGQWYQNIPPAGSNYTGFDPKTGGTWTPQTLTAIMPATDVGNCLAFVNQYLLIGGRGNTIYPWDLNPAHNTYSTPLILLPEIGIYAIISVANNGYIFAGNRGNIYITNGSQADLFKKIPDHISGTVEPYFYWGGSLAVSGGIIIPTQTVAYNKDRLYFGFQATSQATAAAVSGYGGIWALDLNTKALWNSNIGSYGTYSGFVSAMLTNPASGASLGYSSVIGYGFLAGWNDGTGASISGVDASVAAPYTGTQAIVVSDIIPVGTSIQPMTPQQFEYKLVTPLQTGESVTLSVGSSLADYTNNTMTTIGTTNGTGTELSAIFPSPIQSQQWAIVKAQLASKATTPSLTRLTEIRIKGQTGKDNIPTQPFSIA